MVISICAIWFLSFSILFAIFFDSVSYSLNVCFSLFRIHYGIDFNYY